MTPIRLSGLLEEQLNIGRQLAVERKNMHSMIDLTFISMISSDMSHASNILGKLLKDWEIYQLKVRIEREVSKLESKPQSTNSHENPKEKQEELSNLMLTDTLREITEFATPTLVETKYNIVNSGHFLMWLLYGSEFISSRVLQLYGITPQSVKEHLLLLPPDEDYYSNIAALNSISMRGLRSDVFSTSGDFDDDSGHDGDDYESNAGPISHFGRSKLEQFGVNLSDAAKRGELDPIVGRDKEIERLIQILGRRKKNNPILVGEAGVGKSAIVEGLAMRIVAGDVPSMLRGKDIFSLDVASLVAGTKFRGEFEQRIKDFLVELSLNKNIILFIDEIHTIVGAGGSQGNLDTANILKPALARGDLHCIGVTTLDEYREHIESDSALERRFQKIIVEPSTKVQTLAILHSIKASYEHHHSVRYSDQALQACVDLTERYITERHFPDKAIDVMDEAGSKAHSGVTPKPTSIKRLENSSAKAKKAKETAISNNDYNAAERLNSQELGLRKRLDSAISRWQAKLSKNSLIVGVEQIEEVVTLITGIPVERVTQSDKQKLGSMKAKLNSAVVGQEGAVAKITNSIQRSRIGLKDPNKPIGVFLFVGPTGVGKTHLAKELSRLMFDNNSLIRVDMSEYSEKHNVSRIIGSPPGYVGYSEGGHLTEAVRRQPYAVILLDEIEKAHGDVYNVMLQVFDEGRLVDGLGRKIDFRNTIIIMTSNIGSSALSKRRGDVGYLTEQTEQQPTINIESEYRKSIEKIFAPEFVNRIDDIVVFDALALEDVEQIVDLELTSLSERTTSLGYKLKVTPRAKRQLAQMGYDTRYGVRSLKRTILDNVEVPIAQLIVHSELAVNDTIGVDYVRNSIEVTCRESA